MTQIPIYRGLRLCTDEYIQGYYIYSEYNNKHFITQDLIESQNHKFTGGYSLAHWFEIDPTTLSIHFNDMLDSQGNKIFASLSEDGKGGDKIIKESTITPVIYKDCSIKSRYLDCGLNKDILKEFKIIGIQQ